MTEKQARILNFLNKLVRIVGSANIKIIEYNVFRLK